MAEWKQSSRTDRQAREIFNRLQFGAVFPYEYIFFRIWKKGKEEPLISGFNLLLTAINTRFER